MKKALITASMIAALSAISPSCVRDDDTALAPFTPLVFLEDFEESSDGTALDITGWTNFTQAGNEAWKEEVFNGNGYAEMASDGSGEGPVICWLVSPAINLGESQRTLSFQSAHHHLPPEGTALEVFIATDYDGVNVTPATWVPLQAIVAGEQNDWYKFIGSGNVTLAAHGTVHIAFRATKADALSPAAYSLDNIKVF
jgi:hypothetical protein